MTAFISFSAFTLAQPLIAAILGRAGNPPGEALGIGAIKKAILRWPKLIPNEFIFVISSRDGDIFEQ